MELPKVHLIVKFVKKLNFVLNANKMDGLNLKMPMFVKHVFLKRRKFSKLYKIRLTKLSLRSPKKLRKSKKSKTTLILSSTLVVGQLKNIERIKQLLFHDHGHLEPSD